MTRILLTGAQGALGRYIKQFLLRGKQNGIHEIVCIDRKKLDEPGVINYQCDFLDMAAVEAVIEDFKPQKAFLIAWVTTHGSYWNDESNVKWANATINFAENFAKSGGKFLTFAGTCAEYQWSNDIMVEDVTAENPHTLYGKEKLRTSRHLLSMRKKGIIDANSCRLFFPYSEQENENRITSLVVKSLMEDKPIHLRSGDVYRDICHTKHIAKAMCDMSFASAGGLYNMSTGKPLHLGELLKNIAACLGKEHLVSWDGWNDKDVKGSEPQYLFGSNEKIKPYLNVPDDPHDDVQAFVDASVKRFSRKNH